MLTDEHAVTFAEAAEHLPRLNGKKLHTSALWRWARQGVRGVKLEACLLGGRFVTSMEALERFSRALAETGRSATLPAPKPRSARSRRKAVDKARADLERAGI